MKDIKQELITMLNQALRLEYSARIQYLAHAEKIKGLCSEKLIERLQEIASDELKHEEKFRKLIGAYLGGEVAMDLAPTYQAKEIQQILEVNLKGEKDAIDFYKLIYRKVVEHKEELKYTFVTLEHEIRHIILDEEEHVSELETLLG